MYSDFHVHTAFSDDSDTPAEAQIERAIALGMSQICITDHQDICCPYPERPFVFDTEEYFPVLNSLKQRYAGKIDILIGVELGLQPHVTQILTDYVKKYSYDFIIGSVHYVDGIDPYYPEYLENRTDMEGFRAYFEEILKNIRLFQDFDVLGHIDYVVRYGKNKNLNYFPADYKDIIDEILRIAIQHGIGIECNTAGFKVGLNKPHPHPDIMKRYRELGGEILTIGSDGHRTEHLAFDFDKIGDLLKSCGFRYYCTFKNRKPEFHPL